MSQRLRRLFSLIVVLLATAQPAYAQFDAAFRQVKFGVTASTTPILMSGSGTPEAVKTAPPGSIFARTDTGTIYYKNTGTGNTGWIQIVVSGTGTVTSVAATVPSFLSVAGSPITTSGTLAVTLATQTANTLFAGPTTGSAAAPTFRAMVAADIPSAIITFSQWASNGCSSGNVPQWNGSAWICSAGGGGSSPLTTKGDLFTHSTIDARQAIGTDGQYLMADSAATNGISWQTVSPGSGAGTSLSYVTEAAEGTLSNESVLGTKVITTAADASKQSAAISGRLFLPSDGFYLYRDTGSVWTPWGPIFQMTPPDDTQFSWVNQSTASVTTANGGIFLRGPAGSAANMRIRVKTAPATPYTLTVGMIPMLINQNQQHAGILFRESSSGKIHTCEVWGSTSIGNLSSSKWTNATTFSADYSLKAYDRPLVTWLRIVDNGTNRTCSFSSDGINFSQLSTITRLDFLTTGADQIGYFVSDTTNSTEPGTTLLSWKEQ